MKLSQRLLSAAVGPTVRHSDRQHGAETSTLWDQLLTWTCNAKFPMGNLMARKRGRKGPGAKIEVGHKNPKNVKSTFSDVGVV